MRRPVAACLCALSGFVLVLALLPLGAVERLELLLLDARYATGLGRVAPGDDVVIAWIDQESLDYAEKEGGFSWPWPRDVYAPVLQHLRDAGARAVVFDLLFDQRGSAAGDTEFGNALAGGRGDVLAMKFVDFREDGRDAAETAAFAAQGLGGAEALARTRERGVVLPLPELVAGADRLGFVNIRPDADKTFRRYDLLRLWGPKEEPAKVFPSLAAAAALAGTAAREFEVQAGAIGLPGGPTVAAGPGARMLLNFRGPEFTFPKVKFVNVLLAAQAEPGEAPRYPPETFRDRIVLIGVHAEGYEDAHQTPLSERFPGVELHATAIDNLLRGDALRAPAWDLPLAAAAAALGTAAVFLLPGALAPLAALGLLLLLGLGLVAWTWLSLLAVPVAAPALAGGTSAVGSFLWRLVVEGRQKREMRRAFQSYLAPEVLAEVLRDPQALRLGGELRDVTLLFTDLQGFTGLSERCQPHELVAFLNDYFTRMCKPVLAEHGVVDKFIGDAIMAFFGAPVATDDHGRAAVRAAVRALQVSRQIAAEAEARGIPGIATRIGVHTGPAVIGNMGSADRFDYTAIGDTVNLAARLEGANKAFGTQCLASETAWAMAAADVVGREVGRIGVVGRQAPIRVYEPLALRAAADAATLAFADAWRGALDALRAGDRGATRAGLERCLELRPGDGLAALWLEKLQDPSFDGEFRLDKK
ncbi:MAG: adenylate/guanylate cyclase domain-containing protein [Planctomycetes bacterium]|nr:adenylate/guanylate cyclase domain-containing protein [Planctomycetota bacterium]